MTELLTLRELAAIVKLCTKSARALPIPVTRVGGRLRYDPADVQAYIDRAAGKAEMTLAHALAKHPPKKTKPNICEPVFLPGNGFVYFAKSGQLVKIGFARNVGKRIAALQTATGNSVKLLGSCEGSKTLERQIHAKWEHCRRRGEWFCMTPELSAYIREVSR